jgi:hypothetical protein
MNEMPLLQKSWQCRVCAWAAEQFYLSLGRPDFPFYSDPHPASAFFSLPHQLQSTEVAKPIVSSRISNHRCKASSSLTSS